MNNFAMGYQDENQMKVYNFLSEVGVCNSDVPYREALQCLKKYLSIRTDANSFKLSFGQFALAADDYILLDEKQMESIRKYLKKVRGCKLYVRSFPTLRFWKKELHCFAEPGQILWEMSSITGEMAPMIAQEVSNMLNVPLRVLWV